MASFNLIDYYNAINGTSSLETGVWHTNFDKRHALKISSDFDAIDEDSDTMILPPTPSLTDDINTFSEKLGQKLNNTKIIPQGDGSEIVELELDDRVVTFVIDQSGSMSWNDSNKFRHMIAQDISDKIENNYPGEISYNLLSFGSKFVNVILFGVIEEDTNVNNPDAISDALSIDNDENFKGIRVVRTTEDTDLSYNPAGGNLMSDGFLGKMLDQTIAEGITYYYWVYSYDVNLRMSKGRRIKVVPRERIVPRGVSIFRSFVENEDITKGTPLIGTGISRDDNTLGIWHFNEGRGTNVFDFSSTNAILSTVDTEPVWYNSEFVPTGTSGMYFNGISDYSHIGGEPDLWRDLNDTQPEFTVMAWVYPYEDTGVQTIVASVLDSNINYGFVFNGKVLLFNARSTDGVRGMTVDDVLILNQWQHVCATYDNGTILLYHNGILKPSTTLNTGNTSTGTNYNFSIGARILSTSVNNFFHGKITEVSIHDTVRSSTYINDQLTTNSITDFEGNIISTEIAGIKDDNGDRINVSRYEVPEDYNFIGGKVKIVRNYERVPEWEEDGDEIFYGTVAPGIYYVADVDDMVLGDNVYYRIYSQNTLGNFSFASDSLALTFEIDKPSSNVGFPALTSAITSPIQRTATPITTAGNRKVAIKWGQDSQLDDRIEKVKVFYSRSNYPVVNDDGGTNGELIFNGTVTDNIFVHRKLDNNVEAFYTIVNVDRYGRSSEYNAAGNRTQDSLQSVVVPVSGNDENTIPLEDVSNLHYEIVDDDSVSVVWDQPSKNPENINAFLDQTVVIYTSITDQFGIPLSDDTPMRMFISSEIIRDDQADDVFGNTNQVEFADRDAYTFNVIRTDDGILKASLSITRNPAIVPNIAEATFEIQVKAFVPKEGYQSPTDNTANTTPLEEYAQVIDDLIEDIDGGATVTESSSGENIFEYMSKKITIKFTNPWELELVNKENMMVDERCYFVVEDKITKEKSLGVAMESFNGVYMKASAPFVARAKLKYKGEPVDSGSVQIAVWDADDSILCANASSPDSPPPQGEKIQPSITVLPPDNSLSILQGEEQVESGGETITVPISYVDIPLYAPDKPQAVQLYVKGERAGFDSVKNLYILFQNILKIDIQAFSPNVDGSHLAEQQAQVYIVNPDYPNINLPFDKSLITYPDDNTVIQWVSTPIDSEQRSIYSIDEVPIPNGVYSYTRNGVARNVFMGPVGRGSDKIDETHEISATVVFNGLSAQAKQFINIEYEPAEYNKFSARFLMEVDGGWIGDGLNSRWGGAGWLNVKNGTLWTDGSDYKKMKISRNPRIATDSQFGSASCFRECATREDSEILELSSGQIVHVHTGDDNLEILHGNITEVTDPYTGDHTLVVEDGGSIDDGDAFIELNDESVSDITYFYIRANKFVPESGGINPIFELDEDPINDCLCLKGSTGLFKSDLPKWEPVNYISGTTTLFVNNRPLTLIGGGSFRNGIPPCPIGLKEPLVMSIVERRVLTDGETFWVDKDNFLDPDGHTYVKDNSDVFVKVRIDWKREGVPEGTPISVRIGEGTASNLFVASQDRYFAEEEEDGLSYVTVQLAASRVVEDTTTEQVRIFSTYDENGKTDRNIGITISLTIDKEDAEAVTTLVTAPITDVDPPVETPYSRTLERYDILNNEWEAVNDMRESRGDAFIGAVDGYLYVIGGLRDNSMTISSKTERYDPVTDTWNYREPMPTPRFGGSSIVFGKDIYTIGGIGIDSSEGGELDVSIAMEVYHTDTDEWETTLSNMPIENSGLANELKHGVAFGTAQLITVNDSKYIYVLCGANAVINTGGSVSASSYNNVIMRYHIGNDVWEISDNLYSDELATYSRISPLSMNYNNQIVVFNGAVDNGSDLIFPNDEFTIDVTVSLSRVNTERYINFGSSLFSDKLVPKYQSAFAEYDINPSDDSFNYYILGGFNNDSASLDIMERLETTHSPFFYDSSYDVNNPSLTVSSLPTAKHGASAVYMEALDGSDLTPHIYLVGGYTSARGDDFVDITFDI